MSRLRNGGSLIGSLVGLLVLIGAAAFYFSGGFGKKDPENARPDGKGSTVIGRAMLKADDTACKEQVSQVRQLIYASTDHVSDTYPTSLDAVSGLPNGYDICPIGEEQYDYDPSTGEVSCPHPGHEEY